MILCPSRHAIFGTKQNPKSRSLVTRGYIRQGMMPQKESKPVISFSTDGYYDELTDITIIHAYVEECFRDRTKDIPEMDRQMNALQRRLDTEKLLMIDRNQLSMKIDRLKKKRSALLSSEDQDDYQQRIGPFLEEWTMIMDEEGPYIRFGEKENFSPNKLSLIRNFIQVASDYVPLNLTLRPHGKTGHCPRCRNPYLDNEDGKIICEECGVYRDLIIYSSDFSDFSRVNASGSNDYNNQETYLKSMNKYQGKQQPEFPEHIFEDFDQYCRENGINPKALTQETTRPIFKKLGYKDFYDDINLFLYLHLGKPLPELAEYESILIQDYDLFSQKYNEIKEDERDSALGAQYVLYILVRRRKIGHAKEDFHLPDTPSIRMANDNMARRVFRGLGWTFEDTI